MGRFCPIKSFQMSIVSFSFYVRGTDGGREEKDVKKPGEEEEEEGD